MEKTLTNTTASQAKDNVKDIIFWGSESLNLDKYWKIDPDRAIELEKSHDKEIQIYSYILSLIEKDNKL